MRILTYFVSIHKTEINKAQSKEGVNADKDPIKGGQGALFNPSTFIRIAKPGSQNKNRYYETVSISICEPSREPGQQPQNKRTAILFSPFQYPGDQRQKIEGLRGEGSDHLGFVKDQPKTDQAYQSQSQITKPGRIPDLEEYKSQ